MTSAVTTSGHGPDGADRARGLDAARAAASEHRWSDAFVAFSAADQAAPLERADLDTYGEAAWWTGQLTAAIRVRERAFAAHLKAGDERKAAAVALALANDYGHRLQGSRVTGWVKRAERLLETMAEGPEHALLGRARLNAALSRGDLEEALRHADEVLAIGRRIGNQDIYALGVHDRGRVLVLRGEVEEGLALLDEAVVAAISDELSPFVTAVVYCNSTVACQDLADYRRAAEFAEAAREWCDRQAIAGFPGMCRVRRAEVTRLRGRWDEAEHEARQACVELEDFCLDYAGEGFYQIGEIRLRMGDFEAADDAFRRAHELGRDPVPGLAQLRVAQGKPSAGVAILRRALDDPTATRLHRARLLAAYVEIASSTGPPVAVDEAARELSEIAEEFGTHALRASAATAAGILQLRRGEVRAAIPDLERARRLWQETDAPYEVARARVLIADAYRALGDDDAADLELVAARSTFERLGAKPDLAALDAAQRAGDRSSDVEHVSRTMMFTDIVRSTDLIDAIGDDAWTGLLSWHDRTIRALLAAHHGEEVHHAGDGFFAVFATADEALACAIEIQRRLGEHRRQHGFAPKVRIGLHAGDAVRTAGGYEGRSVHAAARIGAQADGDEILASSEVVASAERSWPYAETRRLTLRGIRTPVEVVRVLADAPSEG